MITAHKIFVQLFHSHSHSHFDFDFDYDYCYYSHYKMETIFINTENSKTNESHRFKLDLADKRYLKNPKKNFVLVNLSIYYTWKNIKSEYNNKKFEISAPTWNDTRFRKYVKGYEFLSFTRKFGDKYGKNLIDTATKTEMEAAKTASKRVVQKTAEATGDLIGDKIADKITSIGESKEKEKPKETEEISIPPQKRQQTNDDLRLF